MHLFDFTVEYFLMEIFWIHKKVMSTGEHKLDMLCLQNILSQVLVALEHLHSIDIVHKNLRFVHFISWKLISMQLHDWKII